MDFRNRSMFHRSILFILGIYILLSLTGYGMVRFRAIYTGTMAYRYLLWNLFLAWVPLGVSVIMNYLYIYCRPRILRMIFLISLGCIWLPFYPNAPYILTDFIHLNQMKFYFGTGSYNMSFIVWYDFIMICLFVLTGFFIGFVSLYLVHNMVKDRFGSWLGWVFVFVILFLSSFGIYLGRFIRWNSWDLIYRPMLLLESILESFHNHALAFTFSFGTFLVLMYIALYTLTTLSNKKCDR
ncbi:putative membrane protein [Anaerosolibacter carboniphilus]|uniref:Putative membrane protein n=1 Tax=Anaerosolibacter carboniphilus TaxID=1417629 RepID=A0A841KPG3_9FIRM|nr:DUF1361 domain-containing protein [Anaerosolibacter carboniphilus]MBB6215201.1 putative membrane protein [Anaerosolibacter carboniphilus]